jgi:hypothetical protein
MQMRSKTPALFQTVVGMIDPDARETAGQFLANAVQDAAT